MMNMYALAEDYEGTVFFVTDLTKEQISVLGETVLKNDENGVGECLEDICERMFALNEFVEISFQESCDIINRMEKEIIFDKDYLTISKII